MKLSSPGPVIFKQRRNGLDGEEIIVYKFRSMRTQDNGAVVKQATKGDSRITPFGAFIRKTSLDELPQFINVLQGRMSLVGPRPHAVAHNEMYRKLIKGYMVRHKVKPGITGWAQINGWRGEIDNQEKINQHGKRADSIVRNMLLHSRHGSGERRPADINALVDEGLNLAYHGARAEKQGFNITLEREFDPGTGVADIYPQEVTRVLLNLISNGFYAATQRAAAGADMVGAIGAGVAVGLPETDDRRG